MDHPQTQEVGNDSGEYHELEEYACIQTTDRNFFIVEQTRDASTQTPEEFFFLETTRDASTQTPEEFFFLETTRDASTQTPEDGLCLLEQTPGPSETTEKSRKRKISNERELTHDSDVGKAPRTETSGRSDEFVSSSSETSCRNQNFKDIISAPSHTTFKSSLVIVNPEFRCFENNSLNGCALKKQPPVETEQRQSTCLACQNTISEHVVGELKYKCCRCLFISDTFHYLQMHIYNEHTKPYNCDVCQLKYSVMGSHARGGTCSVCNEYFKCKYQLEEHYISVHKDFLETNCKICRRKFDDHLTAGEVVKDKYQCCVIECKIGFNTTGKLNLHLCTHSLLQLSKCEVCGHHFKHLQRHLENVNVHPLCKLCGKRFLNSYFLNEHRSEEHKEE